MALRLSGFGTLADHSSAIMTTVNTNMPAGLSEALPTAYRPSSQREDVQSTGCLVSTIESSDPASANQPSKARVRAAEERPSYRAGGETKVRCLR
jgi:hypothetical protein